MLAARAEITVDFDTEAHLQGAADREPTLLIRPAVPNDVWSADFVFDRTAEGRVVKCLTIVDDATIEAVAIVPSSR